MQTLIKRSLVGLALMTSLATGAVFAQAPPPGAPPAVGTEAGPGHHGPMSRLNLTPDQQSQIHSIMASFRAQRKADMEAFEANARQVLNQQQMARLEAMKAEREQHRGEHRQWQGRKDGEQGEMHHHGHHHGGLDRMARELNLTQEQKAQLQAYMESQRPHLKAEREAMIAQVRNVLTPEQRAQMDQMRQQHHHHDQQG